jgi:hypothetical protein
LVEPSPFSFVRNLRVSQWVLIGLAAVLLAAIWIRVNPTTWVATRRLLAGGMSLVGMEAPESLAAAGLQWRTPTGRIYAGWSAWLKRLGLAQSTSETPAERAAAFEKAFPAGAEEAWSIVDAYAWERFGGRQADAKQVRRAWRGLQGRLWGAWAWKLTTRWRG